MNPCGACKKICMYIFIEKQKKRGRVHRTRPLSICLFTSYRLAFWPSVGVPI